MKNFRNSSNANSYYEQVNDYVKMFGDTIYVDGEALLDITYRLRMEKKIIEYLNSDPRPENIDFGDTPLDSVFACIRILNNFDFKVISLISEKPMEKEAFKELYSRIMANHMNNIVREAGELSECIAEDIYNNPANKKYCNPSDLWQDERECQERIMKVIKSVLNPGRHIEK